MRVSSSITIPDDLEQARSTGDLVVFAGAGVSMGPPSNLPSFTELATTISQPLVDLSKEELVALDKYLGDAERNGVNVQSRARDILSGGGGSHTPLHEHLVGLFADAERVRLITTNFDGHFSAAAARLFGLTSLSCYVGPALPPGQAFRGIVHLHGSLSSPQNRLVLTDRDFASAYLADGWATRFLVGVFAECTVLFAGYSLTDPVMRYLMRARPANPCYALCRDDERDRWIDLGVIPVTFAVRSDGDPFGDLSDGLKRWHWYANTPASGHDQELRRIVTHGPPTSPVDADYTRARLKTNAGFATFWDAATTVAWFDWIASERILDVFMDASAEHATVARWADWALTKFCESDQPPLLRFLRMRTFHLHPVFSNTLALQLAAGSSLPSLPVLRQLVALLVTQTTDPSGAADPHLWLLKRLIVESYFEEALELLRWMTRVRLESIERAELSFETDGHPTILPFLTNRVGIYATPAEVMRLLEEHGASLVAAKAEAIAALGVNRIREAYSLLNLARGANDHHDWLSYGRTTVAPSSQDRDCRAEDVFVLVTRIACDYWRDQQPDRLLEFGREFSTAHELLLRRIALYALAGSSIANPDEILDLVVAHGWPRVRGLRPELHTLLKEHFPHASEESRAQFFSAIQDDAWWKEVDEEHRSRVRSSLSKLLVATCPDSLSAQAFAKERRSSDSEHGTDDPEEFFDSMQFGLGGSASSPIGSDEMIQWKAGDAIRRFSEELGEGLIDDERGRALLDAVQHAILAEPHWGVEFLLAATLDATSDALLDSLVWGLRQAPCSEEDRLALLVRLVTWSWPAGITSSVASLVERWGESVKNGAASSLLDALDRAADQVYLRAHEVELSTSAAGGWMERSWAHPGGRAARTWWHVADARNHAGGKFLLSVTDAERERWHRALEDTTAAGAAARVVLGMMTERLSDADLPWTTMMIFPAFDPVRDPERAAQLWDGRLTQPRWNRTTIAGLMPYLPAFLEQSAILVPARARQLGDFVALMLTHPAESHFSLSLLRRFVQYSSTEAREAFAKSLPRLLDDLEPDARRALWDTTLSHYWVDRRTSVPAQLTQGEIAAMLYWVIALPEVASAVVTELKQTTCDAGPHADRFIGEWEQENAWLRAHPTEAVAIIMWLAKQKGIAQWNAGRAVKHLQAALEGGAPTQDVLAAAETLAELPCKEAVALAVQLRTPPPLLA